MSFKLIGALCVILGCGVWGFMAAAHHNLRLQMLRQMISAMDLMECELQYRRTPLPVLFRQAAAESGGRVRRVFFLLSQELEAQISPNAEICMASVLDRCGDLPESIAEIFRQLGNTLGRFDIDGQLRGIEAVKGSCREQLNELMQDKDARVRGYQTLGLCAGAAMAILFV